MNPSINSYQMTIGTRDFLLVDVTKSPDILGTVTFKGGAGGAATKVFYASDEALINMTRPPKGDDFTDMLVHQISTLTICDENIKTILASVSDNYFTYSQSMNKSLLPALEILTEGIYVCYEAKMIPSDGNGNFFWTSYSMRHEVSGTAEYNRTMGKDSNYIPCFLVPTTNCSEFSENKIKSQHEKLKAGKKIGGLAYHMSGMFSLLLDGHHSATACLAAGEDFRCLVIEPLSKVLYENPEQAAEFGRAPKIIALACPYVKIPVSEIPPPMLESFLLRRSHMRPKYYSELRRKANKSIRTVSRRQIPRDILLKAELLPDSRMIESAYAVTELSDEQLDALLSGEIKYDDKIIISANYYNSIVTACNYLQYDDFERFLGFAFAIINNHDLTAMHKYVIERLCTTNDKKIHDFLSGILNQHDPAYIDFEVMIDSYIRNYNKYVSDNLADKENKAKKLNRAIGLLGSDIGETGLAQMEAIVKASRRG